MILRDENLRKKMTFRYKAKNLRIIKPLGINIIRNYDPLKYLPVPTF